MSVEVNKGSHSKVSDNNSSTTTLSGGATFTGIADDVLGFGSVTIASLSDVAGTLYTDFSPDGINWDSTLTFTADAAVNEVHRLTITRRYFRIRYVNGSSAQSYFRLQVIFGPFVPLTSALSGTVQQDSDSLVTRPIDPQFTLASGKWTGQTLVQKFGENQDVDGAEDIWDGGGDYTGFPASAETIQVISSLSTDGPAGTGALTARLFGLDSNYNQIQEDVTLNGTSGVTTTQSFLRMHRAYVLTSGSNMTNNGTLTFRHSTTTTNIFSVMAAGAGQTRITAYTIPAGYTGYIIRYSASLLDNTANSGIMGMKARYYGSNTWLIIRPFAISTVYDADRSIYGGLLFPEKTDGVLRCISILNANARITAEWDMLLVKN